MKNNCEFTFSIVMAVYNAAPYLDETLRSIRGQSIGFDKIQIILADDGSTDGSGRICDAFAEKYPRNVIVLHLENGGPSRARNAGIEHAAGRYLNFMDSDDRMTPETLETVAAFLAEHETETDVAAVPVQYFDAEEGGHWQNARFEAGSRVIDLKEDFAFLQAAANSAFFVRERVGDVRFQEGLSYAEDTRYAMTCLSRRQTIGLVRGGCYEYRRRDTGNSLSQTAGIHPLWKTRWMDEYELWAVDFFQRKMRSVPRWVQYALLCHLGNRVYVDETAGASAEEGWYTEKIRTVIACIEPAVFAAAEEARIGIRLMLRSLMKPGGEVSIRDENGDRYLTLGGETVGRVRVMPARLDQVRVQDGKVKLEGLAGLYPGMKSADYRMELVSGETRQEIAWSRAENQDITWNGFPIQEAYAFRAELPVNSSGAMEISFRLRKTDRKEEIRTEIALGERIPVLPVRGSSGWTGGWKYIVSAEAVHLFPCASFSARAKRELGWCAALLRRGQTGALQKRLQYDAMKLLRRTPEWVRQASGKNMNQLDSETKYNADLLF